jgi:predicted ester cyclase
VARLCRLKRRARKGSSKCGRFSFRAFPDIHVTVEDLIAEGDKVVARHTVTGTNRGEYMGRPPTGRSVTYNEMFILRFANGRIAEVWGVVDVLSQMKQLGVIQA